MASALNWFEISVADMDRALKFYNTILGTAMTADEQMPGFKMAMFPVDEGGIGGALLQGEGYVPSMTGTVVYLNGGDDLAPILGKVEAAGGKVLGEKMDIGEYGFVGYFADTEGNKLGLHSMG